MFVAAMVVVVPVVGAFGFGFGGRLPDVGRLAWTLWFERFVAVPAEVVVVLEVLVVLDVVLAAVDAWVPPPGLFEADVWMRDVDVRLTESVPVVVPAFAADAMAWPESDPPPTDADACFEVLDPPHAASPITAISPIANARLVMAKRARRGTGPVSSSGTSIARNPSAEAPDRPPLPCVPRFQTNFTVSTSLRPLSRDRHD